MTSIHTEARSYYGPGSPFSWTLDDIAVKAADRNSDAGLAPLIGDAADARQRLNHEAELRTNAGVNADTAAGSAFAGLTMPQFMRDAFADAATSASPIRALFGEAGDIPAGALTMKIPAMTTSVSVGAQAAESDATSEASEVTATISVPIATLVGIVNVSIQGMELVAGLDELIAQACGNQYAAARDAQLLNGTGANGQTVGILATTSPGGNFTDTQASPTPVKNLTGLAKAFSLTATGRKRVPDAIIMHPRRWAFMASDQTVAFNPLLQGERVVMSTDVPTTVGTNQDQIAVVHTPDLRLYERAPQVVTAWDQAGIQSGKVAVSVYGYVASPGMNRYPSGLGIQSGSDLAAPSGF